MKRKLHYYEIPKYENRVMGKPLTLFLLTLFFIWQTLGATDSKEKSAKVKEDAIHISEIDGGTLSEDPFTFCVGDGHPDHVSKVSVEGAVGPNGQWVVTDETGLILGLPPTPEAVDFDDAGQGVCLIWYLSYGDGLTGLMPGNNALTDLVGDYDL
ncbi:MAG: hypothetical protein ACFCUL_00485, partial [Flavobacteriaceae bacterium]